MQKLKRAAGGAPGKGPGREARPPAPGEASSLLLVRAKAGDAQALDQLYRRYLSPLQNWARGRLPRWARDVADTDDLVQDTLMRSLRGVEDFEAQRSGAFLAYLCQGVLNRMRDEIRSAGRRQAGPGTVSGAPDPGPSPLEETLGKEAVERYEAALMRLRPEEREAIVARFEMGLSFEQVAEALGKASADAARVATRRAVLRLADVMADDEQP